MSRFVVKGKKGLPGYQIKATKVDTTGLPGYQIKATKVDTVGFNFSVSSSIFAGPAIITRLPFDELVSLTVDSVSYSFDKLTEELIDVADVINLESLYLREFSDIADVNDTVALLIGLPYSDSITGVDNFNWLLNKPITDEIDVNETTTLSTDKPITDEINIAEGATVDLIKVLYDAANVADLVGVPDGLTYQFGMNINDNATTSELFERVYTAVRNFDDVSTVIDNLALDYSSIYNELITISDVDALSYELNKVLDDDVTSADILTLIFAVIRDFDETITTADNLNYIISKPLTDSIFTSDILLFGLGRELLDTFNVNEGLFYDLEKGIIHIATTSDSINAIDFGKGLQDTLTMLDSDLSWSFSKSITDLAEVSEALNYALDRPLEDSTTLSDVAIPVYAGFRSLTDSNTTSDNAIYSTGKVLNETVPVLESLQYTYSTSFNDAFSVLEVHALHLSRPLTDNVTSNADFIDIRASKGLFSEASTSTSEITFNLQQTLGDTASITDLVGIPDGITFLWHASFSDSISNSDNVAIGVGRILNDTASTTEAGSLIERSYFAADFVEFDDTDFSTAYDFVTTQTF
jgi:hypothetical protein